MLIHYLLDEQNGSHGLPVCWVNVVMGISSLVFGMLFKELVVGGTSVLFYWCDEVVL